MKRICGWVLTFFLFVMIPGMAHAEWFIEPYAGAAFTSDEDIDLDASAPGASLTINFNDVSFEESLLLGVRGGYWFPAAPYFGIGLDVFHFQPNIESQTVTATATAAVNVGGVVSIAAGTGPVQLLDNDVDVLGISFDAMFRLRLAESPDFPNGQFQPYATVGPTLFVVDALDEDDTTVGVKIGAGVQWMFTKNLGIFAEYRYTHFSAELESTSGTSRATLEIDGNTHSVLGGVSFRF